jgi:hypothetical protein
MRNAYTCLVGKPEGENLGVDEWIILGWILEKYD